MDSREIANKVLEVAAVKDVLAQLAAKPWRDADLVSKHGRDLLVTLGYVERWNGINFLTQRGYAVVDSIWGLEALIEK